MHRTFKSNIITNGSIKKDPTKFGKYIKLYCCESEDGFQKIRTKKTLHKRRNEGTGGGMKWTRNISEN